MFLKTVLDELLTLQIKPLVWFVPRMSSLDSKKIAYAVESFSFFLSLFSKKTFLHMKKKALKIIKQNRDDDETEQSNSSIYQYIKELQNNPICTLQWKLSFKESDGNRRT